MNIRVSFVIGIVVGALMVSAIFSYWRVNMLREKENILHNMRAQALWTFGSEVVTVAYFLDEYVKTMDYDLIDKEVTWGIERAIREANICKQGLSENSGLIYYELGRTAWKLESYFVWGRSINISRVQTTAQLLYDIGDAFSDFDLLKNKNPLEHLEELSRAGITPSVDEIIDCCKQIQEILGSAY